MRSVLLPKMCVRVLEWLIVATLCTSCLMVAGIEDEYRPRQDAGDGATCPSGQKSCHDVCVPPAPIVGCALDGCEPCPQAPSQGVMKCKAGRCEVECVEGYVLFGGNCMPNADGGGSGDSGRSSGGGGGSGGGTGGGSGGSGGAATCDTMQCLQDQPCTACTGCPPFGLTGCCLPNGKCGGMWFTHCLECP